MDQETKDQIVAFGMGTIGFSPLGVSDAEEKAGQKGLAFVQLLALFERLYRALDAIDAEHPELDIRSAVHRVRVDISNGADLLVSYRRLSDLVRTHKHFLPE